MALSFSRSVDLPSPTKELMNSRMTRGFSLLELTVVVALTLFATTFTFVALKPALDQAHLDSGYETALSVLRNTRQNAIDQRKRFIVTFTAPRTIQVSYWGVAVPPNPAPPPVLVNTFQLPNDMQFQAVSLPNPGPDSFGIGVTAIDFGQGIGAGGLNYVMFVPDGSSQDTLGNLNSGVVYFARPTMASKTRAITVWGATGRIRGWRLDNGVWRQQ